MKKYWVDSINSLTEASDDSKECLVKYELWMDKAERILEKSPEAFCKGLVPSGSIQVQEPKKLTICPKCNKPLETIPPYQIGPVKSAKNMWHCNTCGIIYLNFPEIYKEAYCSSPGQSKTTICAECDHHVQASEIKHFCLFNNEKRIDFITGEVFNVNCEDKNRGNCGDFKEKEK